MSAEVAKWQFKNCGLTSEIGKDLHGIIQVSLCSYLFLGHAHISTLYLIQIHCTRRNCKEWQYGLRGDKYNPHEEGIITLDVSDNPLGDDVVVELADSLCGDNWVLGNNNLNV